MNICEDNHDEIVYDGHRCPLCDAIREMNSLYDEIRILKDDLRDAEGKLEQ